MSGGSSFIGFIKFFVISAFLIGLGVVELVSLRIDRRKKAEAEARARQEQSGSPE